MRFNERLVSTLAILLCSVTCGAPRSKPAASEPGSDKSNIVILRPQVVALKETGDRVVDPVQSKISIEARFEIKFTEAKFTAAQFVDSQNGWASTDKSLYRTIDGGVTWKRLSLVVPLDANISSFFFIDSANGWLTFVNRADVERYGLGNSSHILASNDGGASWIEQARFPDEVDLGCVRFLNQNEGLATGGKVIDPPYQEIFALSTKDGGKNWTNITERLKSAISNDSPAGSAYYIDWISPSRILLLARPGRIISSTDRGETWNTLVRFEHDRSNTSIISSTGYYKLVLDPRGRISVVAGQRGDEGYWGDLVVSEGLDRWIRYTLIVVPILDALFLSDNELLACGQQLYPYDEKIGNRPSVGIILRSPDSGKSWSPLYRSKADETFIYLTKVSNGQCYAISDAGTFLRFVLKNR